MTQEQLLNSINSTAEIGAEGELFALAYERKRLPDCLGDKIVHFEKLEVAKGYDILSFESCHSNCPDRYIEVKTFRGHPHFYWTENEIASARRYAAHYYLYLVDFDRLADPSYEPQIMPNPAALFDYDSLWSHHPIQYAFSLNGDSYIPADWNSSTVLIGCYNSELHLRWILSHNLYNVRSDKRSPGYVTLNNLQVKKASYLLLYSVSSPQVYMLFALEPKPYRVSKTQMKALDYLNPHAFSYILHPIKQRLSSFNIDLAPLLREVNHQGDNTYGTPLYLLGTQLRKFMHSDWSTSIGNHSSSQYRIIGTKTSMAAEMPSAAYKPWTAVKDAELVRLFDERVQLDDIAKQLHRSRSAIVSRLRKIGKML